MTDGEMEAFIRGLETGIDIRLMLTTGVVAVAFVFGLFVGVWF
jgi:hypothetical protein